MAVAGDSYTVVLKEAHLNWGTRRYTYSRERILGEAYIPIPASIARNFNILKGSVFNARSIDGYFNHQLKAAGCSKKGDIHAKQFQGNGDLKVLGTWLHNICNARPGDSVEVRWITSTDVTLRHIPEIINN